VVVRAPDLYRTLRCFALGAFSLLSRELEEGAELPVAFVEHASLGRPALYEYRPLVRGFVEQREYRLRRLEDAGIALEELRREPAAAIYARAHAGAKPTEDDALFRSVLLPLLTSTAETCGGFDWHDDAFDRAYGELEASLLRPERAYGAVAPLVGIACATQIDLGDGLRVRVAVQGELARHWPEASSLLPRDFGREPDRLCVVELERPLTSAETEPPDAPAEIADAVSALRLATAAPLAAGPVLFERLDWRPYGIRPVLPIAATQPAGEPSRLDAFRGRLAAELRARLALANDDERLADALDAWELSLFQPERLRAESVRAALESLLEGPEAVLRAAVLLGETGREREDCARRLREGDGDLVRRALVETLAYGDRRKLIRELDAALLGVRPRPDTYFARAASG
jgi:hypothetical protein